MKKERLNQIVPIILGIAFAVLAWVRLVVQNSELLFEGQNQEHWESGSFYFMQMLSEPGGILSWAGQYLTQYFYYPALGASILIGLWLIIYSLWIYGLKPVWYMSWIGIVFPLLLLFQVTSIGYIVYINKAPDWYFTPTLICLVMSVIFGFLTIFLGKKSRYAAILITLFTVSGLYVWADKAEVHDELKKPFCTSQDDANFYAELRMKRALEEGQWQTVLSEMRKAGKNPTRSMWLMKNVALLNQGRLVTDWLEYPCMTQLPAYKDSIIVPLVESSGPLLYFTHGSIQFSYRWCMENMVEYGPSNSGLRQMTRCALLKGEWRLAEKYINLLSRTTFQKEWAEQQRRYIGHPELLNEDPIYRLAIKISDVRNNALDGDGSHAENYIVNTYSKGNELKCLEQTELNLIYAMQSQDIVNFWNQFFMFAHLTEGKPMPLLIQQAVYLFIKLEPQSAPRHDFPFDPKVSQLYNQFQTRIQKLAEQGHSEEAIAELTQKEFGKTYYWFYFFCRGLKTY